MDFNLVNIDGTVPEPMAGVVGRVYIAPVKDFTLVNNPPETLEGYTTVDTLAKIAVAHTFPAGKGFTTIQGIEETNAISTTLLGENERHIFQNEFTLVMSGSEAELLGFIRLVKNMRFILLFEEVGSGNIRQMGSKRFPARFTAISAVTEAAIEGANSITLTVTDKQKWPAPVYTGDITEKPEGE